MDGKALKWAIVAVAVVAAVAMIVATAGAGIFAAFLMFSMVKPAVNVLGALTGVRGVGGVFGRGTPVWNPQAGTGLVDGETLFFMRKVTKMKSSESIQTFAGIPTGHIPTVVLGNPERGKV